MQLLKSLIYPLRGIDNTTTGQVAPLSEHKKLSPTALDIIFYILLQNPAGVCNPGRVLKNFLVTWYHLNPFTIYPSRNSIIVHRFGVSTW